MGLAALVIGSLSGPAVAQTTVTAADIQRLQDNVYLAERDVAQVRTRDSARATQMQAEVDELRDEVTYLKVKLRKERSLARSEYADIRDRIEDIRARARGDATGPYSTAPAAPSRAPAPGSRSTVNSARSIEIPAGTELDVRLQHSLNSGTVLVEDRFEATTITDLVADGRTAIPAGSVMRGVVTAVEPATRTNRTARMTVSFDQITVNGRVIPVRATVTEAIEGNAIKGEAGRTAAGAGVGAIIGGILGGTKGAIAGLIIGGGGTIAATEGKQVELEQGSVLRVRIDSPFQIQVR
jgi:TolA-binding protein